MQKISLFAKKKIKIKTKITVRTVVVVDISAKTIIREKKYMKTSLRALNKFSPVQLSFACGCYFGIKRRSDCTINYVSQLRQTASILLRDL